MTQRQSYIHETAVEGRRLGRHINHDERSKDYPARRAGEVTSVSHASRGLPLNQGNVGSCTAEATCGALDTDPDFQNAEPAVAAHVFTQDDAYQLYARETKLEAMPWPPNDPGGSGLFVCKAAKQLGWISAYHHAFGLEHALKALVLRPTIWGINWYSGFDSPDPETGLVTITGDVRGGHEIVAIEIDADRQQVGFINSWGSWGLNGTGRFYIEFNDLERLLAEQGDVTVPIP